MSGIILCALFLFQLTKKGGKKLKNHQSGEGNSQRKEGSACLCGIIYSSLLRIYCLVVGVQPFLDPEAEEQAEVCWHCKHSDLKRNAEDACEELNEK